MPRDRLKNAPYNPRRITDDARRKLRKNLETVGLLEPIIWNKRTGNVVGGHQRLKCLDLLEQRSEYLVPVSVVDLDEATERAQNIFLNNGEAQGDWDLLLLADCLKGIPDPDLTGFDRGDLYQLFGCDPTLTEIAPDVPRAPVTAPPEDEDEDEEDGDPPQEFDRREREAAERESGDFFLVVLFGSDAERTAFTAELGLKDNRYVDGKKLLRILKGDDGE